MTIVVRLDHHTIITEVDLPNVIVIADEIDTSVEFHSLSTSAPPVTILLMMDRKEALHLLTRLTRPSKPGEQPPTPRT